MKTIYFIVLLTVFNIISQTTACQDQFLDVNKLWYTGIFQGEPRKLNTEVIKLGEEKNISDTLYYTVLRAINGNENPVVEYGYIRNDNGKIFYRKSIPESEKLVYDFSIEVGDTITVYGIQQDFDNGFLKSRMRLDSIVEIVFYDIGRKVYYLQVEINDKIWEANEQWIEGIGSEYGLLHHNHGLLGPIAYDLRCVFQNSQPIYKRNPNIDCIILQNIDGIEYESSDNLELFPNPVIIGQPLRINCDGSTQFAFEIFNAKGKKINELSFMGNLSINSEEMFPEQGMYFFRLRNKDSYIKTWKIIVQ